MSCRTGPFLCLMALCMNLKFKLRLYALLTQFLRLSLQTLKVPIAKTVLHLPTQPPNYEADIQ